MSVADAVVQGIDILEKYGPVVAHLIEAMETHKVSAVDAMEAISALIVQQSDDKMKRELGPDT